MARTSIPSAFKKLFSRPTAHPATPHRTRLCAESLESREVASVTQPWMSGSLWVVPTNDAATKLEVSQVGTNYVVRDVNTSQTWSKPVTSVSRIEFQGGAGSDSFRNLVSALPMNAFGNGGNDYLEGYDGADNLIGGP